MKIITCGSAKHHGKPCIYHTLRSPQGVIYHARTFAGGRVEIANAADQQIDDTSIAAAVKTALNARWKVRA